MADEKRTTSWWQTVPGVLTGLAAIITAVTGLILALNRTSARTEPATPAASVSSASTPTSTTDSRSPAGAGVANAAKEISLPLHEVTLGGGTAVFTIVSARIEPIDLERRALKLQVRYRNKGRFPAFYSSRLYQVLVGDDVLAPTNLVSEAVAVGSTMDAEIRFELSAATKDAVLQIGDGDDKARIPLTLP
jgi:hypothetical protein